MSPSAPGRAFIQGINFGDEHSSEPYSVFKNLRVRANNWQVFRGTSILSVATTGQVPYLANSYPDYADGSFGWQVGDQVAAYLVDNDSLGDWPEGDYTIYHTGGYARLLTNADAGGGSVMAAGAYTYRDATKTVQPVAKTNGDRIILLLEDQDPLTYVAAYPPGYDPATDSDPSDPANPYTIAKIKEYCSPGACLRFTGGMDVYGEGVWQCGSLSTRGWLPGDVGTWDPNSGNHKPLWHFSQYRDPDGSRSGMSASLMCDIADAAGLNPWLCICPGYTNEQLDYLLTYLWNRYAGTGIKVRLGYGLEPWNTAFPTYNYIKYTFGVPSGTPYPPEFYVAFASELERYMSRIDLVDPDRTVFQFTFDGNAVSPSFTKQTFVAGGLSAMPEVMTIACYFGPTAAQTATWRTTPPANVDEILDASWAGLPIKKAAITQVYDEIALRASVLGVPMPIVATYEGGYSLVPLTDTYLSLMHDAYQHADMALMYDDMRQHLITLGFDEVNWYKLPTPQSSEDGEWGHGRAYSLPTYYNEIRGTTVRGYVTSAAADPDASTSSAVASPDTGVVADGSEESTVTITIRDADSYPLAGVEVTIAVSGTGNTVTQPATVTNASGQTTATVASTVAETKVVTVTADPSGLAVVLDDHPTIGFIDEPPPPPTATTAFVAHKVTRLTP